MRCVFLLLSAAAAAMAGEYAVLASGFRVYVERHEVAGEVVRLHVSGGSIELPAEQVSGFEADDYIAPFVERAPEATLEAAAEELSPSELIEQAAARNGLPPDFVRSVAAAESGFRQDAVSVKGAIGIMQLMPATAAELSADPYDAAQNVEAGTRYLRDLLVKYKDDPYQVRKALAGYNAGPGAVERHNGVPPYPETQRYVERVLRSYARKGSGKQTAAAGQASEKK
jgi:soluble lytic murein transglycosylase-like protein